MKEVNMFISQYAKFKFIQISFVVLQLVAYTAAIVSPLSWKNTLLEIYLIYTLCWSFSNEINKTTPNFKKVIMKTLLLWIIGGIIYVLEL